MATQNLDQEARSRRGEMVNPLYQSNSMWRVYRGLYQVGIRYIRLMAQNGSPLFTSSTSADWRNIVSLGSFKGFHTLAR